jgi:hypothetical protein
MRYLFCRTQTIEPSDQQALQSVGNRERRERSPAQIFVVEPAQQASLQDGPDQLFDEQRHAIRKVDDLAVDLTRQPLASDLIRHGDDLATVEPVEHEGGGVRVARPRRQEDRPVGDEQQQRQISSRSTIRSRSSCVVGSI